MNQRARPINRTRQQRAAARNTAEAQRSIGQQLRQAREDAGLSLTVVAAAAGVAKSYLHGIEDGRRQPSTPVLAQVASALDGRVGLRFEPGAGPAIRDHIQTLILEWLLPQIHSRWKRFPEVGVTRPVRGWIDLVLDDPGPPQLVAAEIHSQLNRLEQQIRWAKAKADALLAGGSSELEQILRGPPPSAVSRLLVLRLTAATRSLATTYGEVLAAAYPRGTMRPSHRSSAPIRGPVPRSSGSGWTPVGRQSCAGPRYLAGHDEASDSRLAQWR